MLKIYSMFGFLKSIKGRSAFAKDILTLISGTVISQIVLLLALPVLARLYSPEDFGIYSIFVSLLAIFIVTSVLSIEHVILIVKKFNHALIVVQLSFIILAIFILGYLMLIFILYLTNNYRFYIADMYFWLMPVSLGMACFIQIIINLNVRAERYSIVATTRVIQSFTVVISQCLLGFLFYKSNFLIIGYVLGQVVAVIYICRRNFEYYFLIKKIKISIKKKIIILRKYRKFPLFQMPSSLIGAVSVGLPVIMITALFDVQSAGFYAMVQRILASPIAFISTSFGEVFRQRICKLLSNGRSVYQFFWKTAFKLALIGTPIFIAIALSISTLVPIILGDAWLTVSTYTIILIPMFLAGFIVSPLSGIIIVTNNNQYDLSIRLIQLIGTAASIYIGSAVFDSILMSISLVAFTNVIKYIYEFILSSRIAKKAHF